MGRHLLTQWLPLGAAVEASGRTDDQGGRVAFGREVAAWNRRVPAHQRVQVLRRKGGRGSIERVEARSLARMLAAKAAEAMVAVRPETGPPSGGEGKVSESGSARRRRRVTTAGLRRFPEGESPFDPRS